MEECIFTMFPSVCKLADNYFTLININNTISQIKDASFKLKEKQQKKSDLIKKKKSLLVLTGMQNLWINLSDMIINVIYKWH